MKSVSVKNQLYFLDLFAGCGGASLGFETAGFDSLGAVEINPIARATLEENFGSPTLESIKIAEGDVTKVNLKNLKAEILSKTGKPLDLLVACPPCQGFSAVGRAKINSLSSGKDAFINDPRNSFYKSVVEYIRVLKPRAVFFENVPGILNVKGNNVAEIFCEQVNSLGYNIKCALLNSALYGVPQSRERVIIIAFREDQNINPRFPQIKFDLTKVGGAWGQPIGGGSRWVNKKFFIEKSNFELKSTLSPGFSVGDAFKDLPPFKKHLKKNYRPKRIENPPVNYSKKIPPNGYCDLMRNWPGFKSEAVIDHFCGRNPRDYKIFRKMKHGDLFPQAHRIATQFWKRLVRRNKNLNIRNPLKAKVVPPYRLDCFPEKWQKLDPKKLSCTLTAHLEKDRYSHIHFDGEQARTITPREAARLQSFPDAYQFIGNVGQIYRQIGNAVPPLLAWEVGLQMRKDLSKVLDNTRVSFEKETVIAESICGN